MSLCEAKNSVFLLSLYPAPKEHAVFGSCVDHVGRVWSLCWAYVLEAMLGPYSSHVEFIEGSLEVKLPTIWRDEKAVSREKSQKRKDQKKEDAGARKGRKVAKHCVFSLFCGSGGLKSRLAKAAGAETSREMRDEKLHAVVARSTFGSKKC